MQQLALLEEVPVQVPSTRYQGSKAKIAEWVWHSISQLRFETVLDVFGGSGSIAYYLKQKGKTVRFNDYLKSNCISASALIANSSEHLTDDDVQYILGPSDLAQTFVADTFEDIFFLPEENRWIDQVIGNLATLPDGYKRDLAFRALFQACLVKRPYNLFHRKNLYMRTNDVERSFGNKTTWDAAFEDHFRKFVREGNSFVFDSGKACTVSNSEASEVSGEFDLVYIDPPYASKTGNVIDYRDFYHFLEGLADYGSWAQCIDRTKKHLPLKGPRSAFSDVTRLRPALNELFRKYASSIIVMSYRSDGIPGLLELATMLQAYKKHVEIVSFGDYRYALSKSSGAQEVLILGFGE